MLRATEPEPHPAVLDLESERHLRKSGDRPAEHVPPDRRARDPPHHAEHDRREPRRRARAVHGPVETRPEELGQEAAVIGMGVRQDDEREGFGQGRDFPAPRFPERAAIDGESEVPCRHDETRAAHAAGGAAEFDPGRIRAARPPSAAEQEQGENGRGDHRGEDGRAGFHRATSRKRHSFAFQVSPDWVGFGR